MAASNNHATYAERLLKDLDRIESAYTEILDASGIKNIDPNRSGSPVVFIAAPQWGWEASSSDLEAARMSLLQTIREWGPRCRLLFPHPTPRVKKVLDNNLALLDRWLTRGKSSRSTPPTVAQAQKKIAECVGDLRSLFDLLPDDEYPVRLVVDTNALIDNPHLPAYTPQLGRRYVVHLLPVVLREIDDLKRSGRTEEVREAARRAERRLKGIRSNGDVAVGVRVEGDVLAKFEHIEPRSDALPDWLDLTVPDDRLVASALLLQSQHPASALYVGTSDINLQTKLSAVGIPYVEPPTG